MDVKQLMARYAAENQRNLDAAKTILTRASARGAANLTDAEGEMVTQYERQAQKARDNYDAVKAIAGEDARTDASMYDTTPTNARGTREDANTPVEWRNQDGDNAAVARGQSFGSHPLVMREAARTAERDRHIVGMHGDLGQMVRAMSTTSGSAVVPTVWSTQLIDKARNAAVVGQAGATVIPMPAKTYQVGRLNTDPTATFKTEGSAVTPSDPSFDYVQLVSTSLSSLVVASIEFMQDAPNADQLLSNAIAASMALEIDKAAFFGQMVTGSEGFNLPSPYPKGLLRSLLDNAPGQVLGSGANGTTPTATAPYGEVLATLYQVRTQNENPKVFVSNDKLVQSYQSMVDTTNQPLQAPAVVNSMNWLTTNAIPSFTQGSMTGKATDLFAGDFSQMLIGQRMSMEIRTLTERYAETGSVGILAYWRGDVQLARPKAFAAYRYLAGAL